MVRTISKWTQFQDQLANNCGERQFQTQIELD